MKNFISSVLLPIVILLKFGESNASGNPGSSGGPHGVNDMGPRTLKANYRTHEIVLRINHEGLLLQAYFGKVWAKPLPGPNTYLQRNYICRIDQIEGFDTVAYVSDEDELMGVRSPRQSFGDNMAPTRNVWIAVFEKRRFKLYVDLGKHNPELEDVELDTGLKRERRKHDVATLARFPDGLSFCVYRNPQNQQIMGAFVPTAVPVFSGWVLC